LLPWMARVVTQYTTNIIENLPQYVK
jgi:flagellar biosynthesis protein FliQ